MSVTEAVQTEDEIAARAAIDAVITAWLNNDANAFADQYSESATIVTVEGLYCKGREPIRGLMTMLYSGPFKGSKVFQKIEDFRFIGDGTDAAVAVAWNGILFGGVAELPPEENRRATYTLSKYDGEWKVDSFQNVFITEPTVEAG
jgi:uncharacterized protein (TIGR02246 family)